MFRQVEVILIVFEQTWRVLVTDNLMVRYVRLFNRLTESTRVQNWLGCLQLRWMSQLHSLNVQVTLTWHILGSWHVMIIIKVMTGFVFDQHVSQFSLIHTVVRLIAGPTTLLGTLSC